MSSQNTKNFTSDPLGYYSILNVAVNAQAFEIKQNYRDIAKIWHPDHNTSDEAKENFQKLSVAYEVLKDDKTRLMYDLLSLAYPKEKFPDMQNLKIYKNQSGHEDLSIRAVSCWRVMGLITSFKSSKNEEICNPKEAVGLLLKTSVLNWLTGWWSLKAFPQNLNALLYNFKNVNQNIQENLTLLIHNSIAYELENKSEKAFLSAQQALEYANSNQKPLINNWIALLGINVKRNIEAWNFGLLKLVQLVFPASLILLIGLALSSDVMTNAEFLKFQNSKKEISYYQEVKFHSGGRTVDDVVVSKVLNIPVDSEDLSKLYYVTKDLDVMYGPDDDFDILKKVKNKTTMRITGITPDEIWYRVMIDSGEMGFVRKEFMKAGIGREIPEDSKIYKRPR